MFKNEKLKFNKTPIKDVIKNLKNFMKLFLKEDLLEILIVKKLI